LTILAPLVKSRDKREKMLVKINMKNLRWVVAAVWAVWLGGCASLEQERRYAALAEAQRFADIFPAPDFYRQFSALDEAYDYINTASIKFARSIGNKRREKGLGAKLIGPPLPVHIPVAVVCLIRASDGVGNSIDLSGKDKPMDTALQQAEDAILVFLVFAGDRAASISRFYLDPKWSGYSNGNAQIQRFTVWENTYETDYPVGWGIEKAFQYVRGEIN
jgi:hypothetical protein